MWSGPVLVTTTWRLCVDAQSASLLHFTRACEDFLSIILYFLATVSYMLALFQIHFIIKLAQHSENCHLPEP